MDFIKSAKQHRARQRQLEQQVAYFKMYLQDEMKNLKLGDNQRKAMMMLALHSYERGLQAR